MSRRTVALLAFALLAVLGSGCSLLPGRGGARPGTSTVAPAEDVENDGSEAPAENVPAPPEAETPPGEATPPAVPPEEAEASDQVQVELSEGERRELVTQALTSLRETRRILGTLDRSKLDAEGRDKLATVESLVANAQESFDDDARAAATLAHKARLLLDEIVPK